MSGPPRRMAGTHATHHEAEPDQQAGKDHDLPGTAHVQEFIALVAQPVDQRRIGHAPRDREPLTHERADHSHQQCCPEHVDPPGLPARLKSRDHRRQIKSCSQPGRRDPENGQLHMPGTRERIRRDLGQREPVQVMAFHGIVGRNGPQRDLKADKQRDHPDVLDHGAHGGGRLNGCDGVLLGIPVGRFEVALPLVPLAQEEPAQRAGARDQQDNRYERPHERGLAGPVVHQRFVRPVVGVGHRVVRAQCGSRPGGPPPPRHERADVVVRRGPQGRVRDRVGFTQVFRLRAVTGAAEQCRVVLQDGIDRAGPLGRDNDAASLRIIRIDADAGGVRGDARGPFRFRQGGEPAVGVEHRDRFAVQHVGGPVGRQVRAMPPHRAELHAAQAPPDVAPGVDVRLGEHQLFSAAVDRDNLRGDRRCDLKGPASYQQQGAEHHNHQSCKNRPKPWKSKEFTIVHNLPHLLIACFLLRLTYTLSHHTRTARMSDFAPCSTELAVDPTSRPRPCRSWVPSTTRSADSLSVSA